MFTWKFEWHYWNEISYWFPIYSSCRNVNVILKTDTPDTFASASGGKNKQTNNKKKTQGITRKQHTTYHCNWSIDRSRLRSTFEYKNIRWYGQEKKNIYTSRTSSSAPSNLPWQLKVQARTKKLIRGRKREKMLSLVCSGKGLTELRDKTAVVCVDKDIPCHGAKKKKKNTLHSKMGAKKTTTTTKKDSEME